jgi:hypothetical protein
MHAQPPQEHPPRSSHYVRKSLRVRELRLITFCASARNMLGLNDLRIQCDDPGAPPSRRAMATMAFLLLPVLATRCRYRRAVKRRPKPHPLLPMSRKKAKAIIKRGSHPL